LLRSAQDDHALTTSSNTNAALALFEKGAQLRQIIFAGLQGDRVDIVPAQHARKFLVALIHKPAKTRSRRAISRVDLDLIAGLSVFQVMMPIFGNTRSRSSWIWMATKSCRRPLTCQRSRKIGRLKIRNEENHGASCDDLIQIIEGQRRICAASLWFEKQNLPDKS
jgi:hypothetical protein